MQLQRGGMPLTPTHAEALDVASDAMCCDAINAMNYGEGSRRAERARAQIPLAAPNERWAEAIADHDHNYNYSRNVTWLILTQPLVTRNGRPLLDMSTLRSSTNA